jgi:hypothetical protein
LCGDEGPSRHAIEDGKIFRPGQDVARRIAPVCIGGSDHFPEPVDCPVCCLADDLRLSIAVEVVDQELGIVSAFPDVLP